MGGATSPYKLNIDGISGSELNNVELEANDSVYIFAQVNVNPTATNLPFIIRDSIRINYNGNTRWVQLEAWGQNAHFFRDKRITVDETWNNDLPYVILGSLVIDPNKTLTINKGCRVYVHADAPILVDGSLKINGLKDTADRVYFRGDRMDDPYKDYPAAWPGIYFSPSSKDNVFNYVVLKNSYQTIVLQDPSPNGNPKIILNECVVDNSYDAGILAVNSSVQARNCLVSNCGKNILLVQGGDYQFDHCTAATIASGLVDHKNPVLLVSNYILVNNSPVPRNLTALFRNCIFWGEGGIVDDEVAVLKNGATVFNVNFNHNLWKVQTAPANIASNNILNNMAPMFDSVNTFRNFYNFRLKLGSPAVNAGITSSVTIDLDGKPRPNGIPDLGCFEK